MFWKKEFATSRPVKLLRSAAVRSPTPPPPCFGFSPSMQQQSPEVGASSSSSDSSSMDLYVQTLTGAAFELRVSPFETVMAVKAKIQRMEGIPVAQQHLIWQSKELKDDCCLQDYSITDGATIKLVLAMRGGPINTRRITVEDPAWREMMEYMESNRDEIWEKLPGGRQVTLLVFRDGDQINFFRVLDRGDGTLSPLAEALSDSPIKALNEEDEVEQERDIENAVTLQKMKLLRKKMEALNIKKKPKRSRSGSQNNHRPSSRSSAHHVLAMKSKMQNPNFSLNKHLRLPPVNSQYVPSISKHSTAAISPGIENTSNISLTSANNNNNNSSLLYKVPCSGSDDDLVALENSINVQETGAVPKHGKYASTTIPNSHIPNSPLAAYRRTLSQQIRNNVKHVDGAAAAAAAHHVKDASNISTRSDPRMPCVSLPSLPRASAGRKLTFNGSKLDAVDNSKLHEVLSKLDPRITTPTSCLHNARMSSHQHLLSSSLKMPSQPKLLDELKKPVDRLATFRPKTTPEKWDRNSYGIAAAPNQELLQTAKDFCEVLSRTRSKLSSQASITVMPRERLRRSKSIEPEVTSKQDAVSSRIRNEKGREIHEKTIERIDTVLPEPEETLGHIEAVMPVDSCLVAHVPQLRPFQTEKINETAGSILEELKLKAAQLQRVSTEDRLESIPKLPPVKLGPSAPVSIVPRCNVCNKKTGLATTYTCRCGGNFCAGHRYAETHNCTYDYKMEGRRLLEQANPMVAAPKLPKI